MKKILLPISTLALAFGLNAQVYFSEDFSSGLGQFAATDSDGDGFNWQAYDYGDGQGNVATSASWDATAGILNPDNWLISSAIDLSSASGSVNLEWLVKAQDQAWANEYYSVYVATSNSIATLSASGTSFSETVGTSGGYMSRVLDVSSFAGQTVYIGIRHHNVSDMFRINIDDVRMRTAASDDATLNFVSLARYATTNVNTPLSVNVTNNGSNTITSLTIDWNDGTAHPQTVSVNIAPGASSQVTHPVNVIYATAVESNINVTITQVNGATDGNPSDNTGSALHNTVSQLASKNVVFEEGTGTWCGYCPRGAVTMDYMDANYPNGFIGIAVHNSDPMMVSAYDAGAAFSGFPAANVDRALLDVPVGQSQWTTYYNQRIGMIVPAAISATSSGTGSNVTINVTATFYTPFSAANYRLGVIMVENNVTGTTSGYNQVNYYAGGSLGPMGGYESLPDPVPAANMVYNHVGRALLGGYAGQTGSVPTTITDGQAVNYSFNYTVPASSTRANMHAVVVLIDQNNGEIVNATELSVEQVGIAENVASIDMKVFPNPAADYVNVSFEADGNYTMKITDMQGREVVSVDYSDLYGAQSIALPTADLMNGNYIVTISTEGVSYNQVLVINK